MKIALVTGANGSLGKSVTDKFLNAGYRVIGLDRELPEEDVKDQNVELENYAINLLDEEAVKKLINKIYYNHDNIDVAVFTAGGFAMADLEKSSAGMITKQYELNFLTAYHPARYVFLKMKEKNYGRIFFIGSKPGMHVKDGTKMIGYALSKSLLFRLAEILNEEGSKNNVVTAMIVPGTIDTPANRKSMPEADISEWVKPQEIAEIIHWHATDDAGKIHSPIIML